MPDKQRRREGKVEEGRRDEERRGRVEEEEEEKEKGKDHGSTACLPVPLPSWGSTVWPLPLLVYLHRRMLYIISYRHLKYPSL